MGDKLENASKASVDNISTNSQPPSRQWFSHSIGKDIQDMITQYVKCNGDLKFLDYSKPSSINQAREMTIKHLALSDQSYLKLLNLNKNISQNRLKSIHDHLAVCLM